MIYSNDKCIKSNVDGLMNKQLTEEWPFLHLNEGRQAGTVFAVIFPIL